MKNPWVFIATLLLMGCSTAPGQEDMKKAFVSRLQVLGLYWVDYTDPNNPLVTTIPLTIADNGEVTDTAGATAWIDSMINETTAVYGFKLPYPDGSRQTLYTVWFLGQVILTSKKALVQGDVKNLYTAPTSVFANLTAADGAEIAKWKAYHKIVFVKDNFLTTRGQVQASER